MLLCEGVGAGGAFGPRPTTCLRLVEELAGDAASVSCAARLFGCSISRLLGCSAARLLGCSTARLLGCSAARLFRCLGLGAARNAALRQCRGLPGLQGGTQRYTPSVSCAAWAAGRRATLHSVSVVCCLGFRAARRCSAAPLKRHATRSLEVFGNILHLGSWMFFQQEHTLFRLSFERYARDVLALPGRWCLAYCMPCMMCFVVAQSHRLTPTLEICRKFSNGLQGGTPLLRCSAAPLKRHARHVVALPGPWCLAYCTPCMMFFMFWCPAYCTPCMMSFMLLSLIV